MYNPDQVRRDTAVMNGFYGVVGTRVEESLKLAQVIHLRETDLGPNILHIFHAPDGQTLKWFTGKALAYGSMRARFTIKAHTQYNGRCQNIITRLRVL